MRRYVALAVLVVFALAGAFLVWAGVDNWVAGDNAKSTAATIGLLGAALCAAAIAAFVVIVRGR